MLIFKAMDINYQSYPPFYKLLNDASKTIGLHSTIQIFKKMLIELCAGNNAMHDGLVNGTNGIFKASTYCDKTIIWIMFQNSQIGTLTRKKYDHYYINNIESK